ncbi:MAG: TetR/AcrR family transcriptional regulator [Lachnospiraceae bacterium]
MTCAFREFARQGYVSGSINSICADGKLSKGLLYHYYANKDELYLACVERCFKELTEALEKELLFREEKITPERYFEARLAFFQQHPEHQWLFCDTLVCQQKALMESIRNIRKPFDELNDRLLTDVLKKEKLAEGISMEDARLQLRLFEDFVSACFRNGQVEESRAEQYDELCRKMLNVMLYGLIARE